MDDDYDIDVAAIFHRATLGDTDALNLLFSYLSHLFAKISVLASAKYKIEVDQINQELHIVLWEKIHTVRSFQKLAGWLYRVASNYCLNQIRHQRSEIARQDILRRGQQPSTRRNGVPMVEFTAVNLPNQEPEDNETLEKFQKAALDKLQKATESFHPALVDGWINHTPRKIIKEQTGLSLPTVYRRMKELLKIADAIKKEFEAEVAAEKIKNSKV